MTAAACISVRSLGRHLHIENGGDAPIVRLRKRQRKKADQLARIIVWLWPPKETHLPAPSSKGGILR